MDPRFGQATSTYRQVQDRNEDLRKIEQSMTELANMINIMSVHVDEQGDAAYMIEKTTDGAVDDTRAGMHDTDEAKRDVKRARKKKQICLCIVIVILIIVALFLGIYFGVVKKGITGSSN